MAIDYRRSGELPGRPRQDSLADILERVLDKGIVIAGDIQINLLDIELLTIKLRLLVASVDKAREMGIDWWEHDPTLTSGQRDLAEENRRLRERIGALDGANIWIVGDVLHSRVARSNILAFTKLGAKVTVCGPPTLIPRGIAEAFGCEVEHTLDRLGEADVVYALRMQNERMTGSFVPSLREYAARYQIDGRRLGARQVLMHPGPVNRGVELSAEVIDSPQAVIGQQVAAGVVVRMAVLYELLAGRTAPDRALVTA